MEHVHFMADAMAKCLPSKFISGVKLSLSSHVHARDILRQINVALLPNSNVNFGVCCKYKRN